MQCSKVKRELVVKKKSGGMTLTVVKSLEELDKLKQNYRKEKNNGESEDEIKITIAMGTCGIAAGAREVSDAIRNELDSRGLDNIDVAHTGCIGLCDEEPLVKIEAKGQPTVLYGNLTPALSRKVVAQHIVNNQVVGEWAVDQK